MYQHKVGVDILNARNISQHTLYDIQHIHINLTLIHCTFYRHADADQNLVLTGTSIPLYLEAQR